MATVDTVDAVRSFITAFNTRDVDALVAMCHERVLYTLDDNYPTYTPDFLRNAIEMTLKRAGPKALYAYATHDGEPVAVLWAPDRKTKAPAVIRVTNFNAFDGKIRLITDSTSPGKLARVTCEPPDELVQREPEAAPDAQPKTE